MHTYRIGDKVRAGSVVEADADIIGTVQGSHATAVLVDTVWWDRAHVHAISEIDPDEPESETGARDVAERAEMLARGLADRPGGYATRDQVGNLARMVAQLAAAVTCYIEDNERRLGIHEISNASDVTRLVTTIDRVRTAEERITAVGVIAEGAANAGRDQSERLDGEIDRLDRWCSSLADGTSDAHPRPPVDTRSPEWQEAYDLGWTAAMATVREVTTR